MTTTCRQAQFVCLPKSFTQGCTWHGSIWTAFGTWSFCCIGTCSSGFSCGARFWSCLIRRRC
ncbi:unnamed protein product [Ixodes pacificus]